jgi:hypothetical protein
VTLRTDVLPILYDVAGGLPVELGLRVYEVKRQIIAWSGGIPGAGTDSVADELTLTPAPEVTKSGEAGLRVGPIVPQFDDGRGPTSYTTEDLNPRGEALGDGNELRYSVTGPDGTRAYQLTGIDDTDVFGYFLTLESLDRSPPY